MTKYSVNRNLISSLCAIMDLTGAEIAKRSGVWAATLGRYISGQQEIPLDFLVTICNKMRIPAYFFVKVNNMAIIPTREQMTLPRDVFQPVSWDSEAVERTFGETKGQISWKDVGVVMGIDYRKPQGWFRWQTRFTLEKFLTVCTRLQLDPFTFLVDPNRPKDLKARRTRKAQALPKFRETYEPTESSEALAAISTTIGDMQRQIENMQEELRILRADNLALTRRLMAKGAPHHTAAISYAGITAEESKMPMAADAGDEVETLKY